MTIVCGTDFSPNAAEAGRAAGALARRLGGPLVLVHVIDELGAELTVGGPHDALFDPLRAELDRQAEALRADLGVDVEAVILPGSTADQLVAVAREKRARLLVVSSLGRRQSRRLLLGSRAERVAQASPLPVLVVREASSLEAWARGERALRVTVGVELTSTSRAALRWATDLRAAGRCDLVVAQIAWPPEEHRRLGIRSPMPLDRLDPELQRILQRDLAAWAGDLPGEGETSFVVSPGWGRVDAHLAHLAREANADLLVVGTHRHAGWARLWYGSVSRGVLRHATTNVACVPRPDALEDEPTIPTYRRVLVPTDFSPAANRAVAAGYGLVAPGGVVHLLHVLTREIGEGERDPIQRLHELVPRGAGDVETQVSVIAEEPASVGILRAAGRLGVDAICMATRGRSGAASVLLGSHAREVVRQARIPVLLVPPES